MPTVFRNPSAEFVYVRTYSRWLEDENRRETWDDTVGRYLEFLDAKSKNKIPKTVRAEIENHIRSMEVVPSMRALWAAGPSLERNNLCAFNCSFLPIKDLFSFSELLFILMCGTGAGFSVEHRYIETLPIVKQQTGQHLNTYIIDDTKEGWAEALKVGLEVWFDGKDISFDFSALRSQGSRLITSGGRSCLTGDTVVYKDRKKETGYNSVTLEQLFNLKKGKRKHTFKKIKLRSLNEETGEFYRNQLLDIIDNGTCPVFEVKTASGYTIKATENHRFMDDSGAYRELRDFNPGMFIAVNGTNSELSGVCIDCGSFITRRAARCRPCADLNQLSPTAKDTTARQRKQNREYATKHCCCEICGGSGRIEVHHKDQNPLNNLHGNLIALCSKCHRVEHSRIESFGNAYAHKFVSYDKIESIKHVGEDRVYDLCMEAPNHNFIANGFVSHNSGPEPLKNLLSFVRHLLLGDGKSTTGAQGRKLTSLECHDICCQIAEVVVVGGTRRCLPKGSPIHTKRGLLPIEEIIIGDLVMTTKGYKEVINTFSQGKQETIKIKTQNGFLECTKNHRVAVLKDVFGEYNWVAAGDLRPGDRLYFSNIAIEGVAQNLPKNDFFKKDHAHTLKRIEIPELDEGVAWILGYFHGNGYVHLKEEAKGKRHGSVSISCPNKHPLIIEKCHKEMCRFTKGVKLKPGHGEVTNITAYSVELAEYFCKFKMPNEEINIPNCILKNTVSVRSAYLAGLVDADGSILGRPLNLASSVYPDYLKQVQNLCASLGIATRIVLSREAVGNWKNLYKINIVGNKQVSIYNRTIGLYSLKGLYNENRVGQYSYSFPATAINGCIKNVRYPKKSNVSIETINRYFPSDFTPVEVTGILNGQSCVETWDIEVAEKQEFIVSGYLVHNSAMISLSDINDDLLRNAKNPPYPLIRAMSNNSVVLDEKPNSIAFLKEWYNLAASGTGERGLFCRFNARKQTQENRKVELIQGLNPCFAPGTKILTREGSASVEDLVGKEVIVHDGKNWVATNSFRVTGTNQEILEIKTLAGHAIKVTPYHSVILSDYTRKQAKDLVLGDELLYASFLVEPPRLEQYNKIVSLSVLPIKSEKVYCCTIPTTSALVLGNGFIIGQCSEILLREYGVCNLSEVIIRSTDKFSDLIDKIKSAVWLGTFQSTLTKFKYIRPQWKKNAEEERLLGVSLTGQLDNPKLLTPDKLDILREYARKINKQAAKAFGINVSAAISCGKPSGSVSQISDSSSGMHPRRAPHYIRRYRISAHDPLFRMMRDQGVKFKPENGQTEENASTWVASFPIKSPKNSVFVRDVTAIDQLKWYLKVQKHWCEHSQSCTIYVGDNEWAEVGAFVYANLDDIIAVSFLPKDNGTYDQAPEEEITEQQYNKMLEEFPKIDYSQLSKYENEDNTQGAQTLACTGDKCEI